jgi:hypothetical protein
MDLPGDPACSIAGKVCVAVEKTETQIKGMKTDEGDRAKKKSSG